MNGDQVIEPGNVTPDTFRAALKLREFEVEPLSNFNARQWIKANTPGEAVLRWAEIVDSKLYGVGRSALSMFRDEMVLSVAEVLDGGSSRGPAKRFSLQTRFVRTYDVLEVK